MIYSYSPIILLKLLIENAHIIVTHDNQRYKGFYLKKNVPIKNLLKFVLRKLNPIPKPPEISNYSNICDIELVPYNDLFVFYNRIIKEVFEKKTSLVHLEFGVFNGTSLAAAYKYYSSVEKLKYRVIGFDSFKGLPREHEKDDGGAWKEGMYSCTKVQAVDCLISRKVQLDKIEFVEGWYKDTLNLNSIQDLKLDNVDVVFVDSDTYSSCCLVLSFIKPLIKRKILICFDDWKLNDLDLYEMGEKRAFIEFLQQNKKFKALEVESYNRKSKSFILINRGQGS
jgi:hypothetical protein